MQSETGEPSTALSWPNARLDRSTTRNRATTLSPERVLSLAPGW